MRSRTIMLLAAGLAAASLWLASRSSSGAPRRPEPGSPPAVADAPPATASPEGTRSRAETGGDVAARRPGPRREKEAAPAAPRGGTLRGRLVFDDGTPIQENSSFTVTWRRSDGAEMDADGDVGPDGRFDTGPVLAGAVERISVDRWNRRSLELAVHGLALRAGEVVERDFLFPAGCDCRARFVDALTGEPIAGAEVVSFHGDRSRTDAEGVARLDDVAAPGEEFFLRLEHPDYPPFRKRMTCPASGGVLTPTFELDRGYRLTAVVQDESGAPLPGIEVLCESAIGSRTGLGIRIDAHRKSARTDAQGRFSLGGFAAEVEYALVLQRDRRTIAAERLVFPEAEARDVFVVHPPQTARGIVVDARGEPVAYTEVVAQALGGSRAATATTAADGTFELNGLFPGSWFAYVQYGVPLSQNDGHTSGRRIASRWFEVHPAGAERLELRLPPGGDRPAPMVPFVVRAFDARTSAPLERFDMVFLIGLDNTLNLGLSGAALDSGELRHSAPEGRYEFILMAGDHVHGRREVNLSAAAAPVRVEFWLEPAD